MAAGPMANSGLAREIIIRTVPGKMRYTPDTLEVRPGESIELVFINDDEMQHNLILTRPGTRVLAYAQKAWALGAEAQARQFVPEDRATILHSKVLNPQERETIRFNAPAEAGTYPFVCTLPGHAFSMKGLLHVGDGPRPGMRDLKYSVYRGAFQTLPDFRTLTPTATGELPGNQFDLEVSGRRRDYAIQFTGTLDVPADGEYTFSLRSDDGSRLYIANRVVVDNDGVHGSDSEKSGKVRLTRGPHPIRLDYFQAQSGQDLQVAWSGGSLDAFPLSVTKPAGGDAHQFHLTPTLEPIVLRASVAGGPDRGISVGFPQGVHLVFNAETCAVEFGWAGLFLDSGPVVGRNADDRGANPARILGQRFEIGGASTPIRIGRPEPSKVAFKGYRRGEAPTFLFEVDGVAVEQTIRPATSGTGFQYDFKIAPTPHHVFFMINPENLRLTSTAGQWFDGLLVVPPDKARSFSVTVVRP